MTQQPTTDVVVYLCRNCIPQGAHLPAQWTEAGARIRVRQIPCSGKIDTQYLLHALEGGVRGVCVMTCPQGECTLAQGNYRAAIRVRTVQHLLEEAGLPPGMAELVHCAPAETIDGLRGIISGAAHRFSALTGLAHRSEG